MIARLNQALIADLQRSLGTSDILEWIEGKCSQLARLGLSADGCIRITRPLLQAAGITEVVPSTRISGRSCITPCGDGGGLRISLRPLSTEQDRRFWIAHEIAHTFWCRRGTPGLPLSSMQARYGEDITIEWLCNRAAAALLVPSLFLSESGHLTLNRLRRGELHLIEKCASELDVPPRLLARRLWHDLLRQEKVVLALELAPDSALQPVADSSALVRWAAIPDTAKPGIRRKFEGKAIPSEALPHLPQARSDDINLSGQWQPFLSGCLLKARSTPFRKCKAGEHLMGRAGRLGTKVFLAVELSALNR
jgi:hypothetical protein